MPEGLVSIGEGAFANSNIKHITIPASVQTIGKDAFKDTGELKSVTIMKESGFYTTNELKEFGINPDIVKYKK